MIKSLYKIGKEIKKEYPEYFQPWANPFPKKEDAARVIVIPVEKGQIKYPLEVEYFKTGMVKKYLYRKVQGANGTNLVPTFLYQQEAKEEKQKDSIRKVLKKVKASIKNNKHDFLEEKQIDEVLAAALLELSLNKDNRYLLTFRVDGKYFGEYQKNVSLFEKTAYDKYSKSSANNKICSITYQQSDEVWGRIDTLGFTVNDKPFNRNGFNNKDSYKMFPASPEAVKILEGASKFVLQRFSQNFYGIKYFILPHFITDDQAIIKEVLNLFIKKTTALPLSVDRKKSIIGNEETLNEIIQEEVLSSGDIYYDLFFYQPNNAQFLIKLHLSDVLPSQLKKIFLTKEHIERKYAQINTIVIPKKGKKEEQIIDFHITFGKIKDYFSKKVKTDTVFHPYFFKILEAVFYNNKLNESQIIRAFFSKIQGDFKNRKENTFLWQQSTKESFSLYQFFSQLNLFKTQSNMETNDTDHVEMDINEFITQHFDFFKDNDFKKGVFMIACITEKLLEKQRAKFDKNEPFLKNLNGLNIDEKQLKKIFPKLMNKINEYKKETNEKFKFYPNEINYIEELAAQAANGIMHPTPLSRTDISYVFTLGMVMQKEFTKRLITERKEAKAAKKEKTL